MLGGQQWCLVCSLGLSFHVLYNQVWRGKAVKFIFFSCQNSCLAQNNWLIHTSIKKFKLCVELNTCKGFTVHGRIKFRDNMQWVSALNVKILPDPLSAFWLRSSEDSARDTASQDRVNTGSRLHPSFLLTCILGNSGWRLWCLGSPSKRPGFNS